MLDQTDITRTSRVVKLEFRQLQLQIQVTIWQLNKLIAQQCVNSQQPE